MPYNEYTIAWGVYYVAVLGLLLVARRVFHVIPSRYIRRILGLTVMVILVTPAIGEQQYWAPAWVIGILESLFGGFVTAESVAYILVAVWGLVIVLYTVIHILFLRTKKETKINTQTRNKKAVNNRASNNRVSPRLSS